MSDESHTETLPGPGDDPFPPVPFPDSYWILPHLFLAGEYPGSPEDTKALTKLRSLVQAGIRHIVDLTEAGESRFSPSPLRPYDHLLPQIDSVVSWARFPISDRGTVPEDSIKSILDHVDRHLAREIPVYVHCWGGHGRTGLVVGCWLARHGHGKKDEVFSVLQRLRREMPDGMKPSPETGDQKELVRYWTKGL